MKDKWIKVEDGLPELHAIHERWNMSHVVLALIAGKYPISAYLNQQVMDNSEVVSEWLFDGTGEITHWQYIELPNDE